MLILAHAGITLGAAVLLAGAPFGKHLPENAGKEAAKSSVWRSKVVPDPYTMARCKIPWLDSLSKHLDIRLLLIGSLLPDIIDKPVGLLLFRDTFSNGRIFCHTLLFLSLITLAGVYLFRRRGKTWLLALAFGTFTHLILDQMWRTPRTLLWPLYGLTFDRIGPTNWISNTFYALLTDPAIYMPELVGMTILAWFAIRLWHRGMVFAFIKHGHVQ